MYLLFTQRRVKKFQSRVKTLQTTMLRDNKYNEDKKKLLREELFPNI